MGVSYELVRGMERLGQGRGRGRFCVSWKLGHASQRQGLCEESHGGCVATRGMYPVFG